MEKRKTHNDGIDVKSDYIITFCEYLKVGGRGGGGGGGGSSQFSVTHCDVEWE